MKNIDFGKKTQILVDEFANGNKTQFGRIVGVDESKIRAYINGSLPRFDVLQNFLNSLPINPIWLFCNNVPMTNTEDKPSKNDIKELNSKLDSDSITLDSLFESKILEALENPMQEVISKLNNIETFLALKEIEHLEDEIKTEEYKLNTKKTH